MSQVKFRVVKKLDTTSNWFLQRIQMLFGLNSSEIKPSHLKSVLKLSNLDGCEISMIDGGANVGEFTDALLKVVPNLTGLCVEPQHALIDVLKKKFDKTNIKCLPVGIGIHNGTASLNLIEAGDRKASLVHKRNGTISQEIKILTLEEIVSSEMPGGVNLIKLDLEGYDSLVLDHYFGSRHEKLPSVLILEISYLSNSTGFTPRKTFQMLNENGYKRIFRTSPYFGLVPLEISSIRDFEGHTVNWIAIHD